MSELYIPTGAQLLSKITSIPQIRLGIQGPPGYGKTWSALTFPNPIVLNFDRGLGAHIGREDVIEVPFYNPQFVDGIVRRDGLNNPPNRKDALLIWLNSHGMKLSPNQTLIIDSNTQVEIAFHLQYNINPATTRSGKIDDFAEWRLKVEWYGELMNLLKSLQCNVIYIAHETLDRDKTGELNGKVRPLLTGQFADQLASHFTDYFRCMAFSKTINDIEKFKTTFGVTSELPLINSTPKECGSFYVWQTISDQLVPHCKTSTLVGAPRYVLANYQSFEKYKRK